MPGVVLFDDFAAPIQNTAEKHQRCDHAERKLGHGGPHRCRSPAGGASGIVRQRRFAGGGERFGDHGTRAERSVVADVSTPAMGQLAQQFLHCWTGPVGSRGRPA